MDMSADSDGCYSSESDLAKKENMMELDPDDVPSWPTVSIRTKDQPNNLSKLTNMSLFTAVEENNTEMLDMLLRQSEVNLNLKNYLGETALMMSIVLKRSAAIVTRLLQSSCDLNIANKKGKTALHLAICYNNIAVAQKLVEQGADLNVQDVYKRTPLYYAICENNLELVCMLLYYGAHVRGSPTCSQTHLKKAFLCGDPTIIMTLIDYYYEFSLMQNPKDPVTTALSRECLDCEDILILEYSVLNGYVETFKLVWPRMDHEMFLCRKKPFLVQYVFECVFALDDWLQCLFLILSSPCALRLVQHYQAFMGNYMLIDLLDVLSEKAIERKMNIAVIYTCLGLGTGISNHDVDWMFQFYGYNEELEALIYAGSYCLVEPDVANCSLIDIILSLDHDCSPRKICRYFEKQILYTDDPNDIIYWFKFFSLSACMKHELTCRHSGEEQKRISEYLQNVLEFPSLLELCRNRVQECIRKTGRIKKTYQFHDAVKSLRLPKQLKDVLLFKRPVYNCAVNSN